MSAFKRGIGALVVLGILASATAYGQAERGEHARQDQVRGERQARQQAPPEDQQPAEPHGIVERRQPPPGPPMPDAKFMIIGVEHADAWETLNAVNMMSRVCGLRVACQVVGGRALIVGSDDQQTLERVSKLVKELDQSPAAESQQKADICLAVPLEKAYAVHVTEHLRGLMPPRKSPPRIVADIPANTVWIAGGEAEVRRLGELARQMDVNAARMEHVERQYGRELRLHKVVHSDAERVAKLMAQLAAKADLDAEIVGDSASQTVVAYAAPAAHEQLERILETLDTQPEHPRKRPPPSRGERGPRPKETP